MRALLLMLMLMLMLMLSGTVNAEPRTEIEHRLMLYRQMYFELEFSADVEELEYLQRKILRLERELEEFGSCPLTFNLSEVN